MNSIIKLVLIFLLIPTVVIIIVIILNEQQKVLLRNQTFDISKRIDIILNKRCNKSIRIVCLISSDPKRKDFRMALRNFFVKVKELRIVGYFLIGEAKDESLDQDIYSEDRIFQDIIKGSFTDHYKNLTLKHLMGLQWANESCPGAEYYIKQDDDTAVDIIQLVDEFKVKVNDENTTRELIIGGISIEGWAYITNLQTIKSILNQTYYHTFFWIDDVLITGTLANAAGIKHASLNERAGSTEDDIKCCNRYPTDRCWIVIGPTSDPEMLNEYLMNVEACITSKKCVNSDRRVCPKQKSKPVGRGNQNVKAKRSISMFV
ncbi:acetylgalactosaminyl-O-glycosyl-glycoprotein beta-1,3-N-acetylglucosaminyltransferase-like isoform X2 [Artemia franciscana]|uniref:acetylgalactosaminyl-O-glycosyl-glycoprotein beta-1,3-N-acetylglucosaminyltransferase-like isoform X2 n=1 Tax=Artemia franciscana TaxID=6661 RepID=UPI0032D9B75C